MPISVKHIDPIFAGAALMAESAFGAQFQSGARSPDAARETVNRKEADRHIAELNGMMEALETNLSFSIDEATKKVVIRVINSQTKEVIRQIPPDETLRIASQISKLMGVLVNEVA